MRLYVSLAVVAILMGVAGLTACNSKESSKSQGGSTASEPSAGTGVASSSSSSTRSPGAPGTSSTPNPVALTPSADGVARITPAEVKKELARNNAYVVDVRNEAAYAAGHIKGAVLIPLQDILAHANELPRNKLIITYCS